MKFLSNSLKVTFLLLSVLFLNGCSSDDGDATTGNIEGVWQLGRIYGNATYSGMNSTMDGDSEGTMEFKSDGTYDSNIISGYLEVTIPSLNYSETTVIEPVTESGTYSYNSSTDDLIIDGETSKVVTLNANFMKIKTLINDSGVVGVLYSEYSR
ncbi:hypothetical protein [Flavobacterium channae]|uniref:hypothetical protein n=1 Tax=Flavobacterium channae TaxID=2897181 RepID=UPI001E290325|nr:hypothetical protein [Flavobacterium channae]UGS22739.1 hypothetical protein LOS89_08105 [Flavobacterium channae]